MAHQYGFSQTVASLGTAFTEAQARLLKRFASKVYFLYDGDSAGQKAMLRGGEALLAAGLDTRVIRLPPEDDPDSFLRREGPDALSERIASAGEYFEFAVDLHASELDATSLAGQAELVERIAPLLLAMRNEVQREAALGRLLARLGGLPREAVLRQIDRRRRRAADAPTDPTAPAVRAIPVDPIERYLLKLMLESYEALEIIRRELVEAWLSDPRLEPWILFLLGSHDDAATMLADAEMSGEPPPGDRSLVTAILADVQPLGDPEHAANQILARLKRRHHTQVRSHLVEDLRRSIGDGGEPTERLLASIQEESRLVVRTSIPPGPQKVE